MAMRKKDPRSYLKVDCVFLFDRAEPHRIYCQDADGKQWTYIERMRENPNMFWRNDIVMVNLADARGKIQEQEAVYATMDGQTTKGYAWTRMSKGQRQKALALNAKLLEVIKKHPEFRVMLIDSYRMMEAK